VNSLAYCTQAVAAEAQAMTKAAPGAGTGAKPPFKLVDVRDFVARSAAILREKGHGDLAASLESLDLRALFSDLEHFEQRLTAIEETVIAHLREAASEGAVLEMRRALDRDLKPYRGKMPADQLEMLEKQFLEARFILS
jgi:hypothetical protein